LKRLCVRPFLQGFPNFSIAAPNISKESVGRFGAFQWVTTGLRPIFVFPNFVSPEQPEKMALQADKGGFRTMLFSIDMRR